MEHDMFKFQQGESGTSLNHITVIRTFENNEINRLEWTIYSLNDIFKLYNVSFIYSMEIVYST